MKQLLAVGPDDYDGLATFLAGFEESETPKMWLKKFKLWWDNNPAFTPETQRGWLLRTNDGIVGFIGNVPTRFQLHGRQVVICNATTWRVLPEFRNQSLTLLFKLINAAKGSILFVTTANDNTSQILNAFRFQVVSRPGDDLNYKASIIVSNAAKVINAKLTGRAFGKLIEKPLAHIVDAIQGVRLRGLKEIDTYTVREVPHADIDFDNLWTRTRAVFSNTNVRSAEVINWQCIDSGGGGKRLFGCYRGSQLTGYMTVWPRIRTKSEINVLECVDLWIDPVEKLTLQSMIAFCRQYARNTGFDMVLLPHFTDNLARCFRQMKLLQCSIPARKEYYKVGTDVNMEEKSSYLVSAQGDYSL
jgi:hypothetical protein